MERIRPSSLSISSLGLLGRLGQMIQKYLVEMLDELKSRIKMHLPRFLQLVFQFKISIFCS